ncbi:hypothetical protein [Altererythrobacter sp. Root672]|nr:hypothetical protein [Altererythrobacter sp. Root672]
MIGSRIGSELEVGTIHDAHYMHRDPALGKAAIQKLEGRVISPN